MSINNKLQETGTSLPIKPEIFLGMATGSLIFGLAVGSSLTQALIELSQATEEVFRGDRLPILQFQDLDKQENSSRSDGKAQT